MARTLQALRRDDHSERPSVAAVAAPSVDAPEQVEDIPFIEVGGKNTPMEASASVLACSPQPVAPLHLHRPEAIEEHTSSQKKDPPLQPKAEPMVAFRSLSTEAQVLAPAQERIAPELFAFHQPEHKLSRQFELVANAIREQKGSGQARVQCFTAASPQIDSSAVALNLAIVEARRKAARLVVVDAQLEDAKTTARLGLTGRPGLRDVLGGLCSLQKVLIDTGIESLTALTAGCESSAPCVIAGDAMLAVLRHLRARFDCVMIDAPAWDGRPDVTALGSACDAVYLVVGKDEAETVHTRRLLKLIAAQGGPLKGCILT